MVIKTDFRVVLSESLFYNANGGWLLSGHCSAPVLRKGGDAYGADCLGFDLDFSNPCRLKTEINRPSLANSAVHFF